MSKEQTTPKTLQAIQVLYGALILGIVSSFGGKLILKKALEKALNEQDLIGKLKFYRKGLLASGLLIDFSAFFALAFFMASLHIAFLVIAGLAFIIIIKDFPTKAKTIKLLQLNYSEEHKLSTKEITEAS